MFSYQEALGRLPLPAAAAGVGGVREASAARLVVSAGASSTPILRMLWWARTLASIEL